MLFRSHYGQSELALFAFIGGLSAATSMVIVASIALSTMVCNNLVMPLLLRWKLVNLSEYRSEERRVGKECRSRGAPEH